MLSTLDHLKILHISDVLKSDRINKLYSVHRLLSQSSFYQIPETL